MIVRSVSALTRISAPVSSLHTKIPTSAVSRGAAWPRIARNAGLPCCASGVATTTMPAIVPRHQITPPMNPQKCCFGFRKEGRQIHRIAFHRKVHQEDAVDEGGEKHSQGENQIGRA